MEFIDWTTFDIEYYVDCLQQQKNMKDAANIIKAAWKYHHYDKPAIKIQRAWLNCIANPKFKVCRRRLMREFSDLI